MVISDDPQYLNTLKGIIHDICVNKLVYLSRGRKNIIDEFIVGLKERCNVGPKSIAIFTRDVDYILDNILGVDFI